jgi:dTMP kinase
LNKIKKLSNLYKKQHVNNVRIKLLVEKLKSFGNDVIVVREPGGTPISEKIREILLDKKNLEMTQVAEILLFSAARNQLVNQVMKPALEAGKEVICDRYYDSTTAYQGYGRGVNLDDVKRINKIATLGIVPDITFFVDIPIDEIKRRIEIAKSSTDRMESSGDNFYERVRKGYFEIAEGEPERFHIMDGLKNVETIHDEIWKVVNDKMKN